MLNYTSLNVIKRNIKTLQDLVGRGRTERLHRFYCCENFGEKKVNSTEQ